MRKYDTIIFDMDGTLLNTIDDIADSVNYVLKKYGYPIRTYDEIISFVGNGAAKLIELALPNGLYNPFYKNCLDEYRYYYSKNMDYKTSPYEGIKELLKELSGKNYKMAIVSNKNDEDIKNLSKKYFSDYINIAIGESKSTMKKPAPDMVYNALKELKSSSETAIFVGDSDVDIQTANNANIPCISVSWGFRSTLFLKEHGASCIVSEPNELLEILKEQHEKLNTIGS